LRPTLETVGGTLRRGNEGYGLSKGGFDILEKRRSGFLMKIKKAK